MRRVGRRPVVLHRMTSRGPGVPAPRAQPTARATPLAGAQAQLDATLAPLGKCFEWGHIDEATHLAAHARLVKAAGGAGAGCGAPQPTSLPRGSLMDCWRRGDWRTRRGLLAASFDELDVLEGQVVSAVPRSEYAAEVAALLESVMTFIDVAPAGFRATANIPSACLGSGSRDLPIVRLPIWCTARCAFREGSAPRRRATCQECLSRVRMIIPLDACSLGNRCL